MTPLKVLFITAWYPTSEMPASGIFVKEYVHAVSLYEDVAVVHLAGPKPHLRNLYQIEEALSEEFPTWRVWHWPHRSLVKIGYLSYLWSAWAAYRRVRMSGFEPDIIHAHVYLAGVPAVLLGKFHNLPVVITEHLTHFPRKILPASSVKLARFAFRRAKFALPVSKSLMKAMQTYNINARFMVIPNVVNTSVFSANGRRDERSPWKLLTVASLDPSEKKGIRHLLIAVSLLCRERDDFRLDIIGDGLKRQEYERLAIELNIADRIVFHGLKSKPEVAEFMRRADIFVLPSLWENCPCVVIEALASGLPIAATNVGGIPEIVPPFAGVLVPPEDAKSLASALSQVIGKISKGGYFDAEAISDYAKKNFSYEAVGKRLHKLYCELVNEKRRRVFKTEPG